MRRRSVVKPPALPTGPRSAKLKARLIQERDAAQAKFEALSAEYDRANKKRAELAWKQALASVGPSRLPALPRSKHRRRSSATEVNEAGETPARSPARSKITLGVAGSGLAGFGAGYSGKLDAWITARPFGASVTPTRAAFGLLLAAAAGAHLAKKRKYRPLRDGAVSAAGGLAVGALARMLAAKKTA